MATFPEATRINVWCQCRVVVGFDPAHYRHDQHGKIIEYSEYGNRSSTRGWEIDHINPVSLGGSDHISNLRALHWETNCAMGGILGSLLSGRR